MPLTNTTISNAKPAEKPTRLFDSRGLFLLVSPNGGKWWRFKYRFGGKGKLLSLGVYPDVTLQQAREQREAFRQMLVEGIAPAEYRKAERQADREAKQRQYAAMRFSMGNVGALSIRLGKRAVNLTPAETAELRTFLKATRAVAVREDSCR